jgi:hypothetical protein
MLAKSLGLLVLSAAAVHSAAIGGMFPIQTNSFAKSRDSDLSKPGNVYKRTPQRIVLPGDPILPTPGEGGRVIILPDPGAGNINNRCTMLYRVKSGDSCWAISQMYQTTVEEIMRRNDIKDPACPIYPGQILCV